MSSSQEKAMLLEAMGIQQWHCRDAGAEVSSPADQALVDNAVTVLVTGSSSSGWLWLTEASVSESEQRLLADIQRAVNCNNGGLLAHVDAASTARLLEITVNENKINRLVVFGKSDFQEQVKTSIEKSPVVQISTLALSDLGQSPSAKRQLWTELKNLTAQ
ncbi:MAG: DNA polymerase III subunit psi [Xanthomonadales bacterium]|nr:DNA polymerase III subunit psi [Xanthomonadales bacterium]